MRETGLEKEADVVKAFPVGSDVEVEVLEVDPAGRRIRLSRKAVLDAQGRDELRDYAERTEAAGAKAFGGSLADKLRGALEPRKE
jgi:ribosomal protein S1